MKGYTLVLLIMAILLLLVPLAFLPGDGTPPETVSSVSDPPGVQDTQPDSTTATTVTTVTTATTAETTAKAAPAGGEFRVLAGDTVYTLDARDFLIRTLAFEMSPSYHPEALKAQAVAAYTYYARRRAARRKAPDESLMGADFATPGEKFPAEFDEAALMERWGKQYTADHNKLAAAVDAVLGKAITYRGELIDACYYAISSGNTESAAVVWGSDVPYLRSVPSPGDRLSPGWESAVSFTADELKEKLTAACPGILLPENPAGWIGTPTMSATGSTVASVTVGDQTLTGVQVRQILSLRSSCFAVSCTDGIFTFTVHGYGHGVGMSQYGADYLARQGYSWEEILHYYYADVQIGDAPQE